MTKPKRRPAPLTDDQLALLQAFIDDSPPGTYDAMDLIPEAYLQYFGPHQEHGKKFKAAVERGLLTGIHLSHLDLGSKHWRYDVRGG